MIIVTVMFFPGDSSPHIRSTDSGLSHQIVLCRPTVHDFPVFCSRPNPLPEYLALGTRGLLGRCRPNPGSEDVWTGPSHNTSQLRSNEDRRLCRVITRLGVLVFAVVPLPAMEHTSDGVAGESVLDRTASFFRPQGHCQ